MYVVLFVRGALNYKNVSMKVTKYLGLHLVALLLTIAPLSVMSQTLAIKTNLVTDALLIPTLGAEYALGSRSTLGVTGTYMPFTVGEKKYKNWSVQPEWRYWVYEPFDGWFFGVNAIGGGFNINNVHVGGLYGKQRQGKFVGGGLSAGYHLMLSKNWSLEFALGADALYCNYERFLDGNSEGWHDSFTVLPIGTAINIVYVID